MSLVHDTGHPFIDVGVATLTAMSKKNRPEDVTIEDLESAAEYLKDIYSNLPKVRNQLSTVFQNSQFTQPAASVEDRLAYADRMLFAFRTDRPIIEGVACTFFPEKQAAIYAFRQHFPLLNGSGLLNFLPPGSPGIPMSGVALLAIHALPLGCIKCGNYLAIHQIRSDREGGPNLTLLLANQALQQYNKAVQMMRIDPTAEFPSLKHVRTRYVEAMLNASSAAERRRVSPHNITGYYFTNFGNKADLQIVRLDNTLIDFIYAAEQDAGTAWSRVVATGWQRPKEQSTTGEASDKATWRNSVYEALFDLPQSSWRFLRQLSLANDWTLIEIFLRKVMLMDQERIDTYKTLGDKLVAYMDTYEGSSLSFYYQMSRARDYADLRRVLKGAAERMAKAGERDPLFTYDQFIYAFEDPIEGSRQWRLGRDLIAIRMLEQLHKRNVDLSGLTLDQDDDANVN